MSGGDNVSLSMTSMGPPLLLSQSIRIQHYWTTISCYRDAPIVVELSLFADMRRL